MEISFRPARPDDHPAMLALCAKIWDGNDYIPEVWDDWLAEPHGQFTAVMDGETLIGLGKLSLMADGAQKEWWLQGLRIDPAYRGQGIGRQLHEHNMALWHRLGGPGVLRLLTADDNLMVQRLCEQTGFQRLARVIWHRAEALSPSSASDSFRPVAPAEAASLFSTVEPSHLYQHHHRLMSLEGGWSWTELTLARLNQFAERGNAWLWHGRALTLVEPITGEDSGAPTLHLSFVGTTTDDLAGCLRETRTLASRLGRQFVSVTVSADDLILSEVLNAAGFARSWDGSYFIYEISQ
ncbi:MAG: GNAT family N-acetyltransferase [Chloroflexi bacterium]|nr:GNAT family N-acetyltransferase [Chloroflexota bacterium]